MLFRGGCPSRYDRCTDVGSLGTDTRRQGEGGSAPLKGRACARGGADAAGGGVDRVCGAEPQPGEGRLDRGIGSRAADRGDRDLGAAGGGAHALRGARGAQASLGTHSSQTISTAASAPMKGASTT